jgi:opacity protein-like surface antigen
MERQMNKLSHCYRGEKRACVSKVPATATACAMILLASASWTNTAQAQDTDTFSISGSVSGGVEYNSNVSIAELESATGESDTAAIAEAALDLNWRPAERLSIDTGYSYSGSRYRDIDAFDLDLHLLYADVSYEFDSFSLGSNYYYADANLGGDDFLTLKQSSLYAGKLFSDQLYLRGALNFADKSFDNFPERNADSEGVSMDLFWFFNEGRSTLVLGYAHDDEDARDRAFSYTGNTLRLRYSNRFSVNGRNAEFQLGVRAQDRDYRGINPEIGVRRDDRQYLGDARLEVSLTSYLAIAAKLERADFRSNLASADYAENRASVSLKLAF